MTNPNEEERPSYKHLRPLVDADILVYRCGFAADSQVKKDGGDPESDYLSFALGNVKSVMKEVEAIFDQRDVRTFLSGSGNFREQVATIKGYKANRDTTHKPKYYREIKDYLINVWDAEVIEGMEADDALAMAQWEAKDRSTVIVSIDKDLDQVPGHHYNFVKNLYYYVNKSTADLFFFKQMLIGDTSDNIPGIKGVGPKTTDKLLAEVGGDLGKFRQTVRDLYKKEYGPTWEEAYHEVGTLLWMIREPDQIKKGSPLL